MGNELLGYTGSSHLLGALPERQRLRLSEEIPHETAPLHAYVNKLLKKLG